MNTPIDLLHQINSPEDLRKIPREQLPLVCKQLRQYIIDTVSVHGGHFSASLGVVELSVALHYVYNTPYDQLIWDVGHQAYGHKILTGRRDIFSTNRKYKGISGFPKRTESVYDSFGVGHSSTSISAALGMAIAAKYKGENRKTVAVVGDGSLTGGMCFEAMNHAGVANSDILIVLNDNNMSIDPNVGALRDYLTNITTSFAYNKLKKDIWQLSEKLPAGKNAFRRTVQKFTNGIKSLASSQANLFESLRIRYFGPIDGHNVLNLVAKLEHLKALPGPKLLHLITIKGKGYALAEKDQTKWHAPGLFDKITGEIKKKNIVQKQPIKYQDVFGNTIIELAEKNKNIVGVTPAMLSGSSLKLMMDKMPSRVFDVGICEQHAVTLSAGFATQGLKPFCNIYSSFMQRAYDQVIHDVALQNLPVIFCLDRAGLVGEDGATHHGCYDIAYLRCIPNLIIAAPMNEEQLRNLMFTAQLKTHKSPIAIRYPRGEGVTMEWQTPMQEISIGKGRKIGNGKDVVILSIGHIGNIAQNAIRTLAEKKIKIAHYDMIFAKPIDEKILHEVGKKYKHIITIEDGTIIGGLGSAVADFMMTHHYHPSIIKMGIPDTFVEHGTIAELQMECGLTETNIIKHITQLLQKK